MKQLTQLGITVVLLVVVVKPIIEFIWENWFVIAWCVGLLLFVILGSIFGGGESNFKWGRSPDNPTQGTTRGVATFRTNWSGHSDNPEVRFTPDGKGGGRYNQTR